MASRAIEKRGENADRSRRFGNPNAKQCTAKAKSTQKRCSNPAISGRTTCRLHGGKGGGRVKHGLYSLQHQTKLAELYESLKGLEDPLDLRPELAMLRSLVQDWIDRYDENRNALLLWSASFTQPRPVAIHDISEGWKILEAVSRVVERIEKARSQNAISRPDLVRVRDAREDPRWLAQQYSSVTFWSLLEAQSMKA
jgi:hypothetical protein